MEKLNPINEIITKQVANENYEYIFVKDDCFVVTDRKIMIIQPLTYYAIPDDQIALLNGKCFSKESFREIQKADQIKFLEEGVFCISKAGTVKKLVFYNDKECKIDIDYFKGLLQDIVPCDGTGVKADYYVKLSKCLLNYNSDNLHFFQIENTNLKMIKDDRYEDQITLLTA